MQGTDYPNYGGDCKNGSFIVVTDCKSSGCFPEERATTPPKLGGSFYIIN
nr:MAG TPA: hypothetical protein [Caudoviricetes sp.]